MRQPARRPGLLSLLLLAAALRGAAEGAVPAYPRQTPFGLREFPPAGARRNAICYGPHRDGQRPGDTEPSVEELREDMHILTRHWQMVRIYGASGAAEPFLALIRESGADLKVMLGAWIAADDTAGNRREIEAAVRLATAYPGIVTAVAVGNETQVDWSAHRCAPEVLIAALREVRARVSIPVTTADDFNFWNKPASRDVAAEVDFITLHAHPLWNGRQLEDGLAWLKDQTAAVAALHPDRPLVIGETGWATMRADEGEQARLMKGAVGEAEQKIFHDAVRAWAEEDNITAFFFEAFDENWKGGDDPAEVEKHWGLYHADRTPKAAMREGD